MSRKNGSTSSFAWLKRKRSSRTYEKTFHELLQVLLGFYVPLSLSDLIREKMAKGKVVTHFKRSIVPNGESWSMEFTERQSMKTPKVSDPVWYRSDERPTSDYCEWPGGES